MTAKEYLSQGYRLEQIIKLIKMDIEYWQDLASSVSSPGIRINVSVKRMNRKNAHFVTVSMILLSSYSSIIATTQKHPRPQKMTPVTMVIIEAKNFKQEQTFIA